jgi:hypothetical protein
MSDFFGALELELRAAGKRSPRRLNGLADLGGAVAAAVAAVALLGAAVVVALTVLGGGNADRSSAPARLKPVPVGTVIPKGEGSPPRQRRSMVVATGNSRGIGPWQLEASRSVRLADPESDEVYQPAGLRCLTLYPLDPPDDTPFGASRQCGEFPRTPGFSRLQTGSERILVYGRVPKRATAVTILVPGGSSINARVHVGPKSARGDFYAVSVKPPLPGARINWFYADGRPGSRGIGLMPPVTR